MRISTFFFDVAPHGLRRSFASRPWLAPLAKSCRPSGSADLRVHTSWSWVPLTLIVAALVNIAAPCRTRGDDAVKTLSFEQDIAPILKAHCLKCHGSQDAQGGLDLSSVASLMK